ncbi:hypothetical protein [Bacillus sp. FJAT-45037]|uniref:hypothetical protein n=1 Tax=Bacillus sp. FJAT-45037 TaxID=2011007 RepID=UPI000C234CBF|nr:hypothetical protein [Bacillus sp. FJAT-45037]
MNRDKRTISVKLNGKEEVTKEVENEVTATREDKYVEEDSFGVSIPEPDKVIDFEALQAEREKRKVPFWDDGNREKSPKLPVNRKKKSSRSFDFMLPPFLKSLSLVPIAVLLSAIIVGVSFGLVVKNVFTGGEGPPDVAQQMTTGAIPTFQTTEQSLPSVTVEVIQGGAFSTIEKAQEMAEHFQRIGLASVLTNSTDPTYLFVGLGADRASTTALATTLQAEGKETYLKSFSISGEGMSGVDDAASDWYASGLGLFQAMMQVTTDQLTTGVSGSADQLKQIEAGLQELQQSREQAIFLTPEAAQASALVMGTELEAAKGHLNQFEGSKDNKELWKAQQSLLRVLMAYEQVVALY